MDDNLSIQNNEQAFAGPSADPIEVAKPKRSHNFLYGILILIALVSVGAGAFYLGMNKSDTGTEVASDPAPTITNDIIANPTSSTAKKKTQIGEIPTDWTWRESNICNVTVPIPPNEEPYIEIVGDDPTNDTFKRQWRFYEAENPLSYAFIKNTIHLSYSAIVEAPDYSYPNVQIGCALTDGYTTENIAERYAESYTAADITVAKKEIKNVWGHDIVVAEFEGGIFADLEIYFVIIDDTVFKIQKSSESENDFTHQTTERIFRNIQFN